MATVVPDDTIQLSASITPSNTLHSTIPLSNNQKLKCFRFTDTYDMHLLKAARSVDAHIPEWKKFESLYEDARKRFMREILPVVFVHSQAPSGKTLADRFKRLISRRRADVKRSSSASGILEKHSDKEVLLDDLIAEIDGKEEATRVEKEELKESEKHLVAAGEHIRDMALKRKSCNECGSDTVDTTDEGRSSSAKKRCRRKETAQSDDEITALILEQAAFRRDMEKGRLELGRERIEIKRGKSEREAERFEKMHDMTSRRLDLDEERFVVEVEERKQSLAEQKKWLMSWSCSAKSSSSEHL